MSDIATSSFETAVSDTLGFYPSYLAAVDDAPEYASLAWRETQQCLRAPESVPAARLVANRAVDLLAPAIDESGTQTDLGETLEFFSFVVFRLGVAITACRYALDGAQTRRARASTVQTPSPAATSLPDRITTGITRTLPQNPDITLHQPAEATERQTALYNRIERDLDTPNVNNIFRALAAEPSLLASVIDAQTTITRRRPDVEATLQRTFAAALSKLEYTPSNHRFELRDRGYDHADIDAVAAQVRAYQRNLPTLVTTLVIAVLYAEA